MASSSNTVIAQVPWWGKVAAKVVLARLPVNYRLWKRLHLFEYGAMDQPSYAHGVFRKHFESALSQRKLGDFVGLELGPGDSLFSAMVAHAYGASAYYLVDAGAFAETDVAPYQVMADFLAQQGLPVLDTKSLTSVEEVLAGCRAIYGTSGIVSLREIPDQAVDFIWSHTVLQHIRRASFLDTMRELRRMLRPDGVCSHWVDLEDNIGGALNNLRFRQSVWESSFMANSGFYTNRIRYSEMLALFRQAGFQVDVLSVNRWDRLPTPRSKLCRPFCDLSEEELSVRSFHTILRPI